MIGDARAMTTFLPDTLPELSPSAAAHLLNSPILQPVITLVLWTLVMWLWLYATRIPAMVKGKIRPDNTLTGRELAAKLPPQVRWKADNYNHLMEQPTILYATALSLALLGV